jgi:hypothetical protein
MGKWMTGGSHPVIPWPLVAMAWLAAEVCLGAVMAALGIPVTGQALFLGGTAIWLTLCVFAPRAYLEAPEVAASIGTDRAWVARIACAAGAGVFWLMTVMSCRA